MNDILARRARRATAGIALSAALVAGIAPATAIAAETSSPTAAVALQTEDAAAAKEKAYAAMQEALKNLEAAKDAASPEKLAEIDDDIAASQELYDKMMAEAALIENLQREDLNPPNLVNPFPPCERTSLQPKPITTRPATG